MAKFAPYFRYKQPLKDFTCTNGRHENFSYSAATMTGWKIMQEDTMLLKPEFCKKWSLFGVFDGHRGNHVSSYLKDNYANHLEAYLDDCSPFTALKLSFMSVDNTIRRHQEEIISKEEENESSEEKKGNVLHFLLSGTLQGEDTDKDDTDFEENKVLNEDEEDSLSESIPLEKISKTNFGQVKKVLENRIEICNTEETIPENEDLNKSAGYIRGPETNMNFKTSNLKLDEASEELQFENTNKEDADFHENKILNEDEGDGLSESIPLEKLKKIDFSQVKKLPDQRKEICNMEETIPENEDLSKHTNYAGSSKINMNFKTSNQKSDKKPEGTDFPGSTGTVVLFKKNKLFVANIGDSKCVASMKGKAVPLTKNHCPADPEEAKRITNAGHAVIEGCIDGNLDVSRAFGDFDLKTSKEGEMYHAVIAYPRVYAVYVTDDIDFIIIASDGVWKSMPDQAVIDFVKERRNTMPLKKINKELFDKVIAPSRREDGIGCDNITAILLEFRHRKLIRTFTQQVEVPMGDVYGHKHKRNVRNNISVIEHISEKEIYRSLEINSSNADVSTTEKDDEGTFTSMTVTAMVPDNDKEKTLEQYADVLWAPINYTLSVPVGFDVEIANEKTICSNAETRPQDKCDSPEISCDAVLNDTSSVKHSHVILPYGEGHSRNFDAQDVEQICENKRGAEDSTIKHSKKMKCSSNELEENLEDEL